jgi:hypothetical protein
MSNKIKNLVRYNVWTAVDTSVEISVINSALGPELDSEWNDVGRIVNTPNVKNAITDCVFDYFRQNQ